MPVVLPLLPVRRAAKRKTLRVIRDNDSLLSEFPERTARKYLTYNGFSAIFGGVDLKLEVVSRTLFRGGPTQCTPGRRFSRN